MVIDTRTVILLTSVLGSTERRRLFTTIADSRIAEKCKLIEANPGTDLDPDLNVLQAADLIGEGKDAKYYVTAKGLQVARDLEKLPIG